MTTIKPTVGRKVWYTPSENDFKGPKPMHVVGSGEGQQPLDATVIAVWNDRVVNVLVTDILGNQFPVMSCMLVQEGDPKPAGHFVSWTPYQVGAARRGDGSAT